MMFFFYAILPFLIGCVIAMLCVGKAINLAFFQIPYLWKLQEQNYIPRMYAANTATKYKRNAWLWAAAITILSAVVGLFVSVFPAALPFLIGVGLSLIYSIIDRRVSESEIRSFANQHMQALMSSGYWATEEAAIAELTYNAKVEDRLASGDVFGGLRK